MIDIKLDDAGQFARLARELHVLADVRLTREVEKSLDRLGEPLKAAVRKSALDTLPRRGGLAGATAAARLTVRVTPGRSPSLRLTASARRLNLQRLDAGRIRHPVFGNRDRWVPQTIRPRWWTSVVRGPARRLAGDAVQRAVADAVDSIGRG